MIIKSNNAEIRKYVSDATLRLIKERSIYSYLIMRIPIIITDEHKQDGQVFATKKYIIFDTSNLTNLKTQLNEIGCENILKHEMMHMISHHLPRINSMVSNFGMDKMLAQLAAEFTINEELEIRSDYAVTGNTFKMHLNFTDQDIEDLKKMSIEEITRILDMHAGGGQGTVHVVVVLTPAQEGEKAMKLEELRDALKAMGWNPEFHLIEVEDKDGEKEVAKELKAAGFKDMNEYMKDMVERAIMQQRLQGNEPGGDFWKKLENELFKKRVNWRRVLFNTIKTLTTQKDDEEGVKYVNRRYYQIKNQMTKKIPVMCNDCHKNDRL